MLVDGDDVVLLPAMTRYEQPGGGTETTTERRVLFSPEIPGPRVGEARAEWEIFVDLARRVDPQNARMVTFSTAQQIRDEIARVVRFYDGIQHFTKSGDQIQVGWGTPLRRLALSRHLTAARTSSRSRRRSSRSPTGASFCRRAEASSSTRWCSRSAIR
jgi:anaerobic selenocysteine-containing dehydrogenase